MIKIRKIILSVLIIVMFSLNFAPLLASTFEYPLTKKTSNTSSQSSLTINTDAEATTTPEFTFQSEAQILIDASTGKVLYEHNADEHLLPASVTKIMTLLLIMEQIDSGKLKYTDTVTCSANASHMGGSQVFFKEGEKLTIDEALKCICVASANDVTVAMAELIGGTEQNFVKMMNAKAQTLGMSNTVFKNAHGIDEDGHYTTARDISIMSRELITKHPGIIKYTSIWMDSIRNGTFGLTNTNKLVRFYEGTIGLKTGSTSKALFNVSAVAKKDNTTLIAVVLKAPTSDIRNDEAKQLLNYGFANFESKKIYDANTVIDNVSINKYIKGKVQVKNKIEISALINKGENLEVENQIQYTTSLKAPIKAGTVVGKIIIKNKSNSQEIASSDLIIDKDINRANLKEYYKYILEKYIMKI